MSLLEKEPDFIEPYYNYGTLLEKIVDIKKAKEYIQGALAAMLDLGKGSGPMNHAFALKTTEFPVLK